MEHFGGKAPDAMVRLKRVAAARSDDLSRERGSSKEVGASISRLAMFLSAAHCPLGAQIRCTVSTARHRA